MAAERVQKILARAGFGSRRSCEALITAGRIRVNGLIVRELGVSADARRDRIEVDGRRVVMQPPAYYLLHKPREYVTTLDDPEGRHTVAELFSDLTERVFPVGRLDFHTSGAILLTNDGALAHALLHPSRHVAKTYVAKLSGLVTEEALTRLRAGVVLDDGDAAHVEHVSISRETPSTSWLQIVLSEGKNRQIHRMLEAVGYHVQRLVRTSFAGISVDGVRPGRWRALSDDEVTSLRKLAGLGALPRGALRYAGSAPRGGTASRPSETPKARSTKTARRERRPRVDIAASAAKMPPTSPRKLGSR